MPPEIAACLGKDDKILWWGQPLPAIFILRGLPNLAYGITWSVLGAFWYRGAGGISEATSAFEGWWRIVPLLSLPFILAGFSFWFYPIRLGFQARRTWYIVTDHCIYIAEMRAQGAPWIRVFTAEERAPALLVKRLGKLHDIILTKRAQENLHLKPRLDSGFFGIEEEQAALGAIKLSDASVSPLS